jgi:hypothetical protein
MKKLSLIVLVLLSMVIGCAIDKKIQTTTEYDGIWRLKMYVGYKHNQGKITVVNGQFHEKYPNGNVIKGYFSADGRFSAYYTFNHGGELWCFCLQLG